VYLGTLAAVRKLDMLLDAFLLVKQSVPNAQLMFVGDGDAPAERHALGEKAEALGLGDDVIFTGFVPMEEAWALSASAAVCLSPFYPTPVLASTSPTKLVEYLALGRPVVCNDHPEQSQIILESDAGLCVAWSAQAFALAIVRLLGDPKAAEAMAANGPNWVSEHRTYRNIAGKVYAKYIQLLGTKQ
jgi:glycosyltransferase involved in cell wall biosynthesis